MIDLVPNVPEDALQISAGVIGLEGDARNLAHSAVLSMEVQLLEKGWPTGAALGTVPIRAEQRARENAAFEATLG